MIVAARCCKVVHAQNPAYRLARYFQRLTNATIGRRRSAAFVRLPSSATAMKYRK
jgi:hypothetical protein